VKQVFLESECCCMFFSINKYFCESSYSLVKVMFISMSICIIEYMYIVYD
jgi:hypothetical protein